MAEVALFFVVKKVLSKLGSKTLEEAGAAWGFNSHLQKLRDTMNTIKDVLLDAEGKQMNNAAVRSWLRRLSTVAYDADDLFDEFATVVSQKEALALADYNKYKAEVRRFCSRSNHLAFAVKMSRQIKDIRERLDELAKDINQFGFVLRPNEERLAFSERDQPYFLVNEEEFFGRDEDIEALVQILIDPNVEDTPSVTAIVGIGGLGKTALAQMVCRDERVKKHFDCEIWVCVSDTFDLNTIMEKMQLQTEFGNKIVGKKFLLVLDDVWNEDRDEWLKLKALLICGAKGSKVLVTTRSQVVARIMSIDPPYNLGHLSETDSWSLFAKMAFKPGQIDCNPDLVQIGKDILVKCTNVPLAIRTIACLLYREDRRKWLAFRDNDLSKVNIEGNNIMSVLRVSYNHLRSPLKHCFAYCSLFPKDYELEKEMLIRLWVAEGFVMPVYEGQTVDDAGEEYFMKLLQRCFLQDIKKDEMGNIQSCKMHDLMHDLAQEVAGSESRMLMVPEAENFDDKIRHLSLVFSLSSSFQVPRSFLRHEHLRTFLLLEQIYDGVNFPMQTCDQLISCFRYLRVLDLHELGMKMLPASIGKLIHLRYLDLSGNKFEFLPDSISELWNLQTLKLCSCVNLKQLPKNLRKLLNLRHLHMSMNFFLTPMPSGMGCLTSLVTLSYFLVGDMVEPRALDRLLRKERKPVTAQLCDLRTLNDLRGKLTVGIRGKLQDPYSQAREANFGAKKGIVEMNLELNRSPETFGKHDEELLEGLQALPPNLKKLGIDCYAGEMFPSWLRIDRLSSLNLTDIELKYCEGCQYLPSFRQLPFLRRLCIEHMPKVEYMEDDDLHYSSSSSLFFPSLEELSLSEMISLKGWWRENWSLSNNDHDSETASLWLSFHNLTKLSLIDCPSLRCMPLCPVNIEELKLVQVGEELTPLKLMAVVPVVGVASTSSQSQRRLKTLSTSTVKDLNKLPRECVQNLSSLEILKDSHLLNLSTQREAFANLSSIKTLKVEECSNLTSMFGALECLTTLEELVITDCKDLDLYDDGGLRNGMPWRALCNLRVLMVESILTLFTLPDGFQDLTALQYLSIGYCFLESLPEWISSCTSLQYLELLHCYKLMHLPEGIRDMPSLIRLEIIHCHALTKRCRSPGGEDWPKIQDIPFVTVIGED